jgi:hypothetical protein
LRSASWSSLDRDPNVLAEEQKETHQPLQREPSEVSAQQIGNLGLVDSQQFGRFRLR